MENRILNTNDEPPIFLRRSYEKEIIENAPTGQLIVQLEAKDSDQQSSNITYLLPKSYRYADYFDLDSNNGELKLIKSLDREKIDHFYVPVYAFDENFKHHTSTLVNVKVRLFLLKNSLILIPFFRVVSRLLISTIIHHILFNPISTLKYRKM